MGGFWEQLQFAFYSKQFGRKERLQFYESMSTPVSYTHLRAHETGRNLVCRLLLEKKKKKKTNKK